MPNITTYIILLFIFITFFQSGYDKIADWNGNVSWLKSHFKDTFLKNQIPLALSILVVLEFIASVLAIIGIFSLYLNNNTEIALMSGVISALTLLLLLFGQRIAKDYEGARTIVIYLIPVLLLLYIHN